MISNVHVPAPSRPSALALVRNLILATACAAAILLFANGFPLLIATAAAVF